MKGLMRSFEAVIAILIITTTFFILFSTSEPVPEFDTINWRLNGFNALQSLDERGELTNAALSNDVNGIKTNLSTLLPTNLNYDLVICSETCPSVSINSEKITSVHYFIPGNITNVQGREVILYLWG